MKLNYICAWETLSAVTFVKKKKKSLCFSDAVEVKDRDLK